MKTPEVIVFDLYDTLLKIENPQKPFLAIFEQCKPAVNLTRKEFLYLILTQEISSLTQTLPEEFAQVYHNFSSQIEEEISSVFVFEETVEVLTQLSQSYPLALISNLASPYKAPFFTHQLSRFFQATFFSCELGKKKPEPSIFSAVEKWSVKSGNQILMVGDNPISDGRGATALGWNFLRVDRTLEWESDGRINSLQALLSI